MSEVFSYMTTRQTSVEPTGATKRQGFVDSWDGARFAAGPSTLIAPTRRSELEVLQGGHCVLVIKANRYRGDLAKIGFGDGCHGFDSPLPVDIFKTPTVILQVRIRGAGHELAGSPVTLDTGGTCWTTRRFPPSAKRS